MLHSLHPARKHSGHRSREAGAPTTQRARGGTSRGVSRTQRARVETISCSEPPLARLPSYHTEYQRAQGVSRLSVLMLAPAGERLLVPAMFSSQMLHLTVSSVLGCLRGGLPWRAQHFEAPCSTLAPVFHLTVLGSMLASGRGGASLRPRSKSTRKAPVHKTLVRWGGRIVA